MKKQLILICCAVLGFFVLAYVLTSNVRAAYTVETSKIIPGSLGERESGMVTRVIDGDSIVVSVAGKENEIRIIGIDAPETYPAKEAGKYRCFGDHAKQRMEALVLGKEVVLEKEHSEFDIYGRTLRHVFIGTENIAKNFLRDGYAHVLAVEPDTAVIRAYRDDENYARVHKKGVWQEACQPKIFSSIASGASPEVRGFTGSNGASAQNRFFGFSQNFKGGTSVAAGDIDGDFDDEIVVGAGKGRGPHVRILNEDGSQAKEGFFAFHPNFRGGINVTTGDVDDDQKSEIAVSHAQDGQAWIKVYRSDGLILAYFNAFGDPEIGASIAFGDVDRDNRDELIVGAGPGGGPHIRVYDISETPVYGINQGATLKPIQFFAFHESGRTGVNVAAGDVDNDGKDEIGVCQKTGGEAWCKVYRYNNTQTIIGEWRAYPEGVESGAYIDMGDIDLDGKAEVVTGAGETGGPQVRTFEANGKLLSSFFAFDKSFKGGIRVGLATFWKDIK